MDYQDCVDLLVRLRAHRPASPGRPNGDLPELLAALGHPQDTLCGVLVVGTNGKGSTAAFAVRALASTGVEVGSLPSPHLQELTERIRVDGIPVSRDAYVAAVREVHTATERHGLRVTASAVYTTSAAAHFRRAGVRLVVAEGNIGGRGTAARALGLEVKVVTGVALDHTDRLGGSLASIASSKAGAAEDGDHVLLGRLPAPAAETATQVLAERTGLTVWRMDHEIRHRATPAADGTVRLDVSTPYAEHRRLPCPLTGAHQQQNLALAVAAADALAARGAAPALTDPPLRTALAATRWPGRLELLPDVTLPGWTGRVLLDGATNPDGVATVAPELRRLAGDRHPVVLFAAATGKDVPRMVAALPDHWPLVLTRTDAPEAAAPDTLRDALPAPRRQRSMLAPDPVIGLHRAAADAGPGGLVIVLGSHRLVGQVRDALGLPPG